MKLSVKEIILKSTSNSLDYSVLLDTRPTELQDTTYIFASVITLNNDSCIVRFNIDICILDIRSYCFDFHTKKWVYNVIAYLINLFCLHFTGLAEPVPHCMWYRKKTFEFKERIRNIFDYFKHAWEKFLKEVKTKSYIIYLMDCHILSFHANSEQASVV